MLHEFIAMNREEIIRRCRSRPTDKSSARWWETYCRTHLSFFTIDLPRLPVRAVAMVES